MKRIMSKEEFLSVYERQQASGLTIKDFMTCHLQGTGSQSKRMAERCHCQTSILSGKRFRQRYPGTASGCLEVEEVQRKSN